MQLSGHKNVQSVVNHSSINTEQQRNMSEILSSTESKAVQKRTTSRGASLPSAMPTTLKLLEGANVSGGSFNILVNTLISSPTMTPSENESSFIETKRKWKRIRAIDSD